MRKILIIEDDPNIRENLHEILSEEGYNESNGYELMLVDNGSSGINFSLCLNPVLIICDITIPGFDGYTVLSQLRRFGRQTPFIFLSSKSDQADIELGMSKGANTYLTKPYTRQRLLDAVNQLLNTDS
ncbi:MAG TPA: response regulator [Cyanobacteria bacterium UBA11162]|nr:response regulator [Cyanobacteria bacterium UBA12227]HAX89568.1 response regulator [Cyanobacteria bacterium UBA11370]HBL10281.1 response regulator [Cyanobacteria bacterium UBA11162]HBY76845.1 response regulator [Cyanobacteria bacterium UBA11148]